MLVSLVSRWCEKVFWGYLGFQMKWKNVLMCELLMGSWREGGFLDVRR